MENAGGNFGHLSGITVEADLSQPAQEIDDDDNITSEGSRVRTATLEDGTEIIVDGEVVPGAPDVTLATVDFLARGGDSYPLGDLPFSILGLSYQASLAEYLVDGIGGTVTAADYPEGGEGRITFTGLE